MREYVIKHGQYMGRENGNRNYVRMDAFKSNKELSYRYILKYVSLNNDELVFSLKVVLTE